VEPVSGFEPLTARLQGAIQQSRNVAGRGGICHLAASTVANCGATSLAACLRWLPLWLPAAVIRAVIGLHESGFADRSLNRLMTLDDGDRHVKPAKMFTAVVRAAPAKMAPAVKKAAPQARAATRRTTADAPTE
jgi:hypothetical protein